MRRFRRLALAVAVSVSSAAAAPGQDPDRVLRASTPSAHLEGTGEALSGLLFVKHGRVGTRSEGPDYYLQTARGDIALRLSERYPWEPDYRLEYFSRRMVEVTGEPVEGAFVVAMIHEICESRIPAMAEGNPPPDAVSEGVTTGPRPRLRPVRAGGLIFVRHGRVGTRSEGPDYFLQTTRGDLEVRLSERLPWEPDPALEMHVGRIVEVEGALDGAVLRATSIEALCATRLPD